MQRYKIKISELATKDLKDIGDYIAFNLNNPSAAKNTINGIKQQINKLQTFPQRHELDDDPILSELGIRKIYYKEYKTYYIIDEKSHIVYILRFLHMLVDSQSWLYSTLEV